MLEALLEGGSWVGREREPLGMIRAFGFCERGLSLDLVTACHAFVAAAGRVVPGLHGRAVSVEERSLLHENIARCRATLDWMEHAVDTGNVDVDDALARLLRGE